MPLGKELSLFQICPLFIHPFIEHYGKNQENGKSQLNPSRTRPSSRYVNVKPVRRSTNLYDVEGTL